MYICICNFNCQCVFKCQLAVWEAFLSLYKILMYIFICKLSHYIPSPSPTLWKQMISLVCLAAVATGGRFLGLVSVMEFSHLYLRFWAIRPLQLQYVSLISHLVTSKLACAPHLQISGCHHLFFSDVFQPISCLASKSHKLWSVCIFIHSSILQIQVVVEVFRSLFKSTNATLWK